MTASLQLSYRRAEHVTADWAKSFYFASRFLPVEKKRAIYALYDYCRHADNLVDARGDRPVHVVREDLAALAREVTAIHGGAAPSCERWMALADTLGRYAVPLEPLLELLDGVAMDLEPVEIQDFAQLNQYCCYVAGGVGLMLGPVLGAAPDSFRESGVRLGIAMQLTNVLRDVGEDLDNDRVYLPADELAQLRAVTRRARGAPGHARLPPVHAMAGGAGAPHLRGWRARGAALPQRRKPAHRAAAAAHVRRHPRCHRADRLRRVPGRAYVSTPRKLMVLGRAMWSERPWTISQASGHPV